jgi:hypothetical protein
MLEILALAALTRRIGNTVETKGHNSFNYKALAVALWLGGEIFGAILGAAMAGRNESAQCLIYIMALIGAVVGAAIANAIADNLPVVGPSLVTTPSAPANVPAAGSNALAPQGDPIPKLAKLKEMQEAGLISAQEYEVQKAEILSKLVSEPSMPSVPISTPKKPYIPGAGTAFTAIVLTLVGMLFVVPLVVSVPLSVFVIAKTDSRFAKIAALVGLVLTVFYCVAISIAVSQN